MSKLYYYIILAISIFGAFPGGISSIKAGLCADTEGGLLTAEDTTRCVNEATLLTLSGSMGNITWLTKLSGTGTWSVISGETDSTIVVKPEADREYAALLTGSCTDTSNTVTLWVSSFATVPNPGFGGEVCDYYFPLSAYSVYAPLTGYWSQVSGPDIVEFYPSPNQPDPDSVTVETVGTYELAWNITDGICTKDSVIEINVLQQPVANAGPDSNQCGRTFNMNAKFSVDGATGDWLKVSGAGALNFIDETDPNTLVNANPGTYNIRWTESNSTCKDDTIIEINVADQPIANAGTDNNSCEQSATLNAYPTIGIGYWSQISGPGTAGFDNNNLADALVSVSDYGKNYVFQWKETNSFCSDSDTVIINFFEQPVAQAPVVSDACGQQTVLTALTSTDADYVKRTWSYVSGPFAPDGIIPVNDSSSIVHIALGFYGNYIFRWKEENGACSDSTEVSISFFEQPVASAGEDISACGLNTALHAYPSMINSDKKWSVLSDPADFNLSDETDPQSLVSSDNFGTYMFVWQEKNNICYDTDTMEIAFNQVPVADPGEGGDTCGFGFILNATPSISASTGYWSVITNSGSTTIASVPNTIANVDSAGTYKYLWTEDNNGCIDQNFIEVTFYEQPAAIIVEAEDACGIEQSILTGRITNSQYDWVTNSGSGQVDITYIEEDKFKVTVSDTGMYYFTWKVFNEQCKDDTTFTIHFFEEPDIFAGEDSYNCGNETSMHASLNLGTGTWSGMDGPGNIHIAKLQDPASAIGVDEFGSYTLRWTVQHGACEKFDDIKIEFIEPPESYAGTDENICGLSFSLTATPENGYWSVVENGSDLEINLTPDIKNANASITVDSSGVLYLAWVATNRICIDSSSVRLNFVAPPVADAGPDQELDNIFETTMQAAPPSQSFEGEWALLSGSGTLQSVNSPKSDVYNMDLGENQFIWRVKNEYCEASDTMKITIYDIFIPEVITPNGDNENDYFVIRGIQNVGPVEVIILNRWGIEVYSSDDYQNDWGGTNKNGTPLTNDTYFYVVNIANERVFKGFVVIKK